MASSVASRQTIQVLLPSQAAAVASTNEIEEEDPVAFVAKPAPHTTIPAGLLSAQKLAEACKAQGIQISLSCNWSSSKDFAREVNSAFTSLGLPLLKDEGSLRNLASLDQFMKKVVKSADYTIILIDDTYLKSLLCITEIVIIVADPHWKERIFPIVLLEKPLDESAIAAYELYWRTEAGNLSRTMGSKAVEVSLALEGAEKIGSYLRFVNQMEIQSIDFEKRLSLMLARQEHLEGKGTQLLLRNRNFTGRTEQLSVLKESLKPNSFSEIAIVGPPGLGKTQLAVEYACRNKKEYRAIYSVRASHIKADYRILGEKMGIAEELLKEETLIPTVKQALEGQTGWLLIFDGAENPAAVREAMPRQGGHLLITSQSSAWENKVFLGAFTEEEALSYLEKISGAAEQKTSLAELAKELENSPASLAMAGAHIRAQKGDITTYLSQCKTELKKNTLSSRVVVECPLTICTTWFLSAQKIGKEDFNAIKLLEFCSYLGFDPIPERLLEAFFKEGIKNSTKSFNAALKLLEDYAIISRHVDYKDGLYEKSVSLYRLTKQISHRCQEIWESRQIEKRYTENISLGVALLEAQFDETSRELLSHAQALTSRTENLQARSEKAPALASKIGILLHKTGDLTGAKEWCKKAIDLHISIHMTDMNAELIPTYLQLGDTCLALKQFDEARAAYTRAKQINERTRAKYNAPFDQKIRGCGGEESCVIS